MFLTMMTNFVPTARENPAFQLMFFQFSIAIFVCIVCAVVIIWLTRLKSKGKFEITRKEITEVTKDAKKDAQYNQHAINHPSIGSEADLQENTHVEEELERVEVEFEEPKWWQKHITERNIKIFDYALFSSLFLAFIIIVGVQVSKIENARS